MTSNKLIWLRHQVYKHVVGSALPLSWFGPEPPPVTALHVPEAPLHLQIVSHCWQYAHMLNFQLSSLVNYPPTALSVTYTLFHAAEDNDLKQLIHRFDKISIPGITWDWVEVPKQTLFRRAIGRNQAALDSSADWLWFSDCDLIFHNDCLNSLARVLQGKKTRMVFPDSEYITDLLPPDHPMLNQPRHKTVDIDTRLFSQNDIKKAKGAFQIVHGDVARTCGYCRDMRLYQQPVAHWSKTYEDSLFRKLIRSEGCPVTISGLHRVRHLEKGRYTKGSGLSSVRQNIRAATDERGPS